MRPIVSPRSDAIKAKVLKEYAAGKISVQEISEKYGVNRTTIGKWAKAAGMSERPKRSPVKRAEKNVRDDDVSPRTLDPEGWVYGTDGIARWQPKTAGTI